MSSIVQFPVVPKEVLASFYVGKSIRDVPTPAAIMNVAAAKANCERMLNACDSLGLGWRAHVKTHKTAELTRFQVGEGTDRPVRIVVSTLSEAEFLLPVLKEYRSQGRPVNVLYGLPIAPGSIPRLATVGRSLGEGSISVLLDDPSQLDALQGFAALSGGVVPQAHIKIDMGGRRAGVITGTARFDELVEAALAAHRSGVIVLSGLYSHAGHSYAGDSRVAAMKMLGEELGAMLEAADCIRTRASTKKPNGTSVSNGTNGANGTNGLHGHEANGGSTAPPLPSLVLSAGASPTALSVQNLLSAEAADLQETQSGSECELRKAALALSTLFSTIRGNAHTIEIHAGVYPTLDLQQLAAHSTSADTLSWRDMAFTILAEVHSVYPNRGANGRAEALIGAGGLALGRETCKAYSGMAMCTPWGRDGVEMPTGDVEGFQGWMVGRFAQEHGILTWKEGQPAEQVGGHGQGSTDGGARDGGAGERRANQEPQEPDALVVGQKLRLWPNHSCITGSHFGWYFVVDESRIGKEDEIVDIWVRARGW
ncbi:hypothetical protein GQ53DRAFT_840756 [Thozetella sp. PMI_491]|nr:hypothetical protein GQ53DRAFT_840756 [Thozetella sp. PMI_491]